MTETTSFTPERSGVYRTPSHVETMRAAHGKDLAWSELDLNAVQNKSDLLQAFANACGFAHTFGENWDALADALQDLPGGGGRGHVLRLRAAARAAPRLGEAWPTLLEVLAQTASYWRSRGKAFVAFLDDAAELPPWT